MPPLSDTTTQSLHWYPTSPDWLGTSTSSSQRIRQWQPSSGRFCLCPCQHRLLGPAPLPLDPSSERPTMCIWMGCYTALQQAPGFRLRHPSGVGTLSQRRKCRWRRIPFSLCSGQPPGDLICRKWWPPPGGTGQGAVNDGSAEDLLHYCINKTGPEVPKKVGSTIKRGFTRAWAHLWGQDRPPLWSP